MHADRRARRAPKRRGAVLRRASGRFTAAVGAGARCSRELRAGRGGAYFRHASRCFNLHYQANGHATTDKTRVGIWLQKGPVTHANAGLGIGMGSETFIVNGTELTGRFTAQVTQDILPPGVKTVPNIPAGARQLSLDRACCRFGEEMMLYSIQPHMHLRGKSMKYTAVYPDGREEELLNVPHYDFNWQIVYEFAKPVTLPAGTTVRVEAAWDNSTKNKYNPRPDQEVFWGEQSWDEMFSPTLRARDAAEEPDNPHPAARARVAAVVRHQR